MMPFILIFAGTLLGASGCYVAVPAYMRYRERHTTLGRLNQMAAENVPLTELSVSRRCALQEVDLLRQELMFGQEPDTIRYHSTRLYVEAQRLSNLI